MSDTLMATFISSGCGLVATLVAVIVPKLWKAGRVQAEIRDQVSNSHGTNLRDDLDHVRDLVMGVHEELLNLRTDAAWERRERTDLTRRIERLEGDT